MRPNSDGDKYNTNTNTNKRNDNNNDNNNDNKVKPPRVGSNSGGNKYKTNTIIKKQNTSTIIKGESKSKSNSNIPSPRNSFRESRIFGGIIGGMSDPSSPHNNNNNNNNSSNNNSASSSPRISYQQRLLTETSDFELVHLKKVFDKRAAADVD